MANNFDLSALALQGLCPSNEILYDDVGQPSIMVKIPKMTYAQLGMGDSNAVHPAFIVNGSEIDAIWISKYQNVVYNSRAYSLPGRTPQVSLTIDNAITYCTNKGEGWHLMTRAEWGAIIRWCEANGFIPNGNNYYGRDANESVYKAIPARVSGDQTQLVATGTGPLSWSHNGEPDGIWDLKGNVWERTGGIRLVYGELQVLANNNAADSAKSQGASSSEWMAVNASDGSLITPDGSGTTSGSVKMDVQNSAIVWSTSITDQDDSERYCAFSSITVDDSIGDDAKLFLASLGLVSYSSSDLIRQATNRCYYNNGAAERMFASGGYYAGTSFGFASWYCSSSRTSTNSSIGFRSAYCDLPSA